MKWYSSSIVWRILPHTLWSELADGFRLASEKNPAGVPHWGGLWGDAQSLWERVQQLRVMSALGGMVGMSGRKSPALPPNIKCIMASRQTFRELLICVTFFSLSVLSGFWRCANHLHWDRTEGQLFRIWFYIYCRNVAKDMLYDTVFPLRGAMEEFFWTTDLFLSYGYCECYYVSLLALVARKPRAVVQTSSGNCTRPFDKHFIS